MVTTVDGSYNAPVLISGTIEKKLFEPGYCEEIK